MGGIMGAFFKGWKRKVGVLTLALAFVFTAGWVRTKIGSDQITIQTKNCVHVLRSTDGQFQWIHHNSNFTNDPPVTWQSWKAGLLLGHPDLYMDFDWRWRWGGFDFGKGRCHRTMPQQFLIIPCPPIAVLFTIVSVFLLLSKPLKSTPKKIPEPAANDGV